MTSTNAAADFAVFETAQWGDQRISPAFYAALAKALGATLTSEEHSMARMTLGDVALSFRQGYGANQRRVTVHAYAADATAHQRAHRYGRPVSFPEATLDPTRPLDALAKDIRKRLIEKSAPALASIKEMDAAQLALTSTLEANATRLCQAFPRLTATIGDSHADIHGAGVSARMSRDGGLYLSNLSLSPAKARAVLAILMAPEA